MSKTAALVAALVCAALAAQAGYAQEAEKSTYHESLTMVADIRDGTGTLHITLQSTENHEILVPQSLEDAILEQPSIESVIITNKEHCILGVVDETCVIINIDRDPSWKGINGIQDGARIIGDGIIGEINAAINEDAQFHSIVTGQTSSSSGKTVISAVYTMPRLTTPEMYEDITTKLLNRHIRNSGGFYEAGVDLAAQDSTWASFSIIENEDAPLYQIRVSKDHFYRYDLIRPLANIGTPSLERSSYFDDGFYPLNSVIRTVIHTEQDIRIGDAKPDLIRTHDEGGLQVPSDLTQSGWIFDHSEVGKIEGLFLFGDKEYVGGDNIWFNTEREHLTIEHLRDDVSDDDGATGIIIVAAVTAIAVAGLGIYLKKKG